MRSHPPFFFALRNLLRAVCALCLGAAGLGVGLAGFTLAVSGPGSPAAADVPSAVTDVNPNSLLSGGSPDLFGGRTEAFAVNPINPNIIFAATEDGGLWKSTDNGNNWNHVDAVPLSAMDDVAFAPTDPNLVIATGAADGSIDNRGGGIWMSTDGGTTWQKAPGSDRCAAPANDSAYKIAFGGGSPGHVTVFVGTLCGISESTNSGSSWFEVAPDGNTGSPGFYLDVQTRTVSGNLEVDACGSGGFFRSTDGGETWPVQNALPVTATPTGNGLDYNTAPFQCSIAAAPNNPNVVFFAAADGIVGSNNIDGAMLLENDNGGVGSWTNLNISNDGNGRPSWVITAPAFSGDPDPTNDFEVFYGTDSIVMHQTCDLLNTPTTCGLGTDPVTESPTNSGPWSVYDGSIRNVHDSTDPATLAFDPTTGCPFLEGGDGGIFRTSDGCDSSPTFTPSNTGQHANEIYQIAGTDLPGHTDLYYGMQDNGINFSTDGASTWEGNGGGGSYAADVFQVFDDTTGPPSSVLSNSDGSFTLNDSDNLFAAPPTPPTSFTAPGGAFSTLDAGAQFGYASYAFITSTSGKNPSYEVQVTTNAGGSWSTMGPSPLPGNPTGLPTGQQQIVAATTALGPVFYLNLNVSGTPTIYRLSGPLGPTATLTPADGGLSSPGAFGVNPSNPLDLYAADSGASGGNGAAMFSTNGGTSWQEDSTLTNLVTQGGIYPFDNGAGGDITSIGFDGVSNTILVGTNYTGVFASTDSGADWITVPGSQQISRVTGFFFDTANHPGTSYVGSYGRGIWRLVLPSADLSITKTATPNPVTAGNQLTYTLTVTNSASSASTAGMINVVDSLPSDVTYLTSSTSCTEASGQLTCPVPDLAPGASFTFTVTVQIDPDAVVGTGGAATITNTASVTSGDSIDPDLSNNSASVSTTVVDSADLSVSKICKPDTTIYEGQPINCTVFIENAGPSWARSVQLDDTTLSNGTFSISNVVVTPGPTTCSVTPATGGKNLDCNVGDLEPFSTTATGQVTVTYTVTGTSMSSGGQNIDNTATVSSDTPDPNPDNNTATVNLTVTAEADLALAMTGPASAVAGTPVAWTLTANNLGPSDALNAEITDTVPAGVTITSVSMPGATCNTGVAGNPADPTVCQFGTLPAGTSSTTMTIDATVDPQTTGVLQNNADVSSATFDPDLANNLASTSTTVNVVSSLSVVKSATPNSVIAGSALSYQLIVSNAGPSTATSIVLTDPLPSGETFLSTGGVGICGFAANTGTVTCTLPNLDPGTSEIVYIYTNVNSSTFPGSLTNTATVSGTGSPTATGSVTTTVTTSADLAISLTSDMPSYKPSSTIHYEITVTNAGPSAAQDVVVVMNLPTVKNGYYVSNNLPGCPPPTGLILTCSYSTSPLLVTIAPGGSVTYQVNFFITGNKGTITSSATVTSATADPNVANNVAITNVTVHH